MELFQLRIFSLAAEYLNFSRVATALFISPPSVTKHIAALEKEVHHTLFVRDGRQLALTEFGASFLPYVNELLEKEDAANRFLSQATAGLRLYTVGIVDPLDSTPSVFYQNLLAAKQNFERQYPQCELRTRFLSNGDLRSGLSVGDVDLALFSIPNQEIPSTLPEHMSFRKLNHIPYTLVTPSQLTHHAPLEEAARAIPALTYVDTPAPRNLAREFTTQYRIAPRLIPVHQWGDALMKTASGECAMFITESLRAAIAQCDVDFYPLDDEHYSNGLYALWWDHAKDHLDDLADCLAQCMGEDG
jgi:DNA-binding transcriptional LysR family regulator